MAVNSLALFINHFKSTFWILSLQVKRIKQIQKMCWMWNRTNTKIRISLRTKRSVGKMEKSSRTDPQKSSKSKRCSRQWKWTARLYAFSPFVYIVCICLSFWFCLPLFWLLTDGAAHFITKRGKPTEWMNTFAIAMFVLVKF